MEGLEAQHRSRDGLDEEKTAKRITSSGNCTHWKKIIAASFARRLKTLSCLTLHEYIRRIWKSEPDRFIQNPLYRTPGLNTYDQGESWFFAKRAIAKMLTPPREWGSIHSPLPICEANFAVPDAANTDFAICSLVGAAIACLLMRPV